MKHTTAASLQKAFKYLFPDEVPALRELTWLLPHNPIVINIGAGAGTSGLAFLESRESIYLVTIDIREDDHPHGSLEAERRVLEESGIPFTWQYCSICGDSKSVGLNWQAGPASRCDLVEDRVDLVFVDGDHTYEGCKGDIEAWLPNVKQGGIMAIHDYRKQDLYTSDYHRDKPHPDYPAPKLFPGVDQAVEELLIGKYHQVMRVSSLIAFKIRH